MGATYLDISTLSRSGKVQREIVFGYIMSFFHKNYNFKELLPIRITKFSIVIGTFVSFS